MTDNAKSDVTAADLRKLALERGSRRSSWVFYRGLRVFLRRVLSPYLRLRAENVEVLNLPGPTVLAPVHRSHLDSILLASLSERRIRALGKDSLFRVPGVSYVCAALGAIPVQRGKADRDALKAAKGLLDAGESMIVFPEGTRQTGTEIGELYDGAAWLAARTGARVIPVGIAGTDAAFGQGAKWISRSHVAIVPGEPLDPPVSAEGKRVGREEMAAFTEELAVHLRQVQSRALELASSAESVERR